MREYNLAKQGHEQQLDERLRVEASWMAMILSTQCTEPVTAEQLLGEEGSREDKIAEGERRIAEMLAQQGRK